MLQLSVQEAERRLSNGDLDFMINETPNKMPEIAKIDPAAPFYAALLLEKSPWASSAGGHIAVLYKEALKSPVVRQAAAEKLILRNDEHFFPPLSGDTALESGNLWTSALVLSSELAKRKHDPSTAQLRRLSDFYFSTPVSEPHRWLFGRLNKEFFHQDKDKKDDETRQNVEKNDRRLIELLIAGRMAVSRASYAEAYRFFRAALTTQNAALSLLFEYHELLNDLGKTFQYAAPREGMKFFLEWNDRCEEAAFTGQFDLNKIPSVRYTLLYYAGRMARQSKRPQEAIMYFEKAMPFAPNAGQKDICIWYVFDCAFSIKEESLVDYVEKYADQWHDGSYFADILDKFSAWASKKRRWDLIHTVFTTINQYADPETSAKYAYIYGRALEHGMISGRDGNESAAKYYRIIYDNIGQTFSSLPLFYYRALVASRLERPLDIDAMLGAAPQEKEPENVEENARALQFLNGFFRFGAAAYALPYIRENQDKLTISQLREIAESLIEAGQLHPAISLSLYYTRREGFRPTRRDLEICYPRGYKDYIEQYADKAGIERALLFALVRRESVFNAEAVSHAGAKGLTQLMPKTGKSMAESLALSGGPNYLESTDVFLLDPEINTHLGALYYRQLSDMTKSPTLAILAYNGGIGNIRKWKRAASDLPDDLFLETVEFTETRNYGRGVLGDEIAYRYLYYTEP